MSTKQKNTWAFQNPVCSPCSLCCVPQTLQIHWQSFQSLNSLEIVFPHFSNLWTTIYPSHQFKEQNISQSAPVLIRQLKKNWSPTKSWSGQNWLQSWSSPVRAHLRLTPAAVNFGAPVPCIPLALSDRVARIDFLTPNFTNLAFLQVVGVRKILWIFGFFFSIFGIFGGSWHILSDWCFGCLKYLAEECYYAFLDSGWCIFSKVIYQLII